MILQEAEENMEVMMDNLDFTTGEGPEPPRNAEPESPMTDISTSAKMITEQAVQETEQVQDTLLHHDVNEPCSPRRLNPSRNEHLQASEMEETSTKGEKEGTGVESQTVTHNRPDRKEITRPPSDDDFPSLASSETHKKTKKLKMNGHQPHNGSGQEAEQDRPPLRQPTTQHPFTHPSLIYLPPLFRTQIPEPGDHTGKKNTSAETGILPAVGWNRANNSTLQVRK
jgi:hypothetical protein